MSFLNEEITFDMGHLLLLLALVAFILITTNKCKLSCGSTESLDVPPVHWKSCRCPGCEQVALEQAQNGYLYGCDPNNPFVPYSKELCDNSYRKTLLHGCGVA